MKRRSWGRTAAAALAALLLAATAEAGPLYDPFLEKFQVGAYGDPDEVTVVEGYPADLFAPIRVDTTWAQRAEAILSAPEPSGAASRRLLSGLATPAEAEQQRQRALVAVRSLLDEGRRSALADRSAEEFLGPELEALRVQDLIRRGDLAAAALRAGRLARLPGLTEWNERAAFVWELRARTLARRAGIESGFTGCFWRSMLELAPYDSGNAWTLWVRCARSEGQAVLPPEAIDAATEQFLSGLGNGWLEPDEIYAAGFEADAQAALGAQLLKGQQLRDHMARFPNPPGDFNRQGLWVKGARFAERGQVDSYERLASRPDLKPGWRMDVWRRASELRFLKREPDEGLADLKRALDLAEQNAGTLSLRRRLRQWCEQALVLAIARGDTNLGRDIHALGQVAFHGEEADAYRDETAYWHRLWDGAAVRTPADDRGEQALRAIENGRASRLAVPDARERMLFARAADATLWREWIAWGQALADEAGPDKRAAAERYRALLPETAPDAQLLDEECRLAALACASDRLGDTKAWPRLLRAAVEFDVARAREVRGPSAESVVPAVLPVCRGSRLDMHALLGFCLALDDLRGVLGVAYELPARGLGPDGKLRFLYPLPGPGPLREAIAASGTEPALVLAIARNESLFEPNVRSRAGALGFMQIMPFHYERRGAMPGADHWSCPEVSIARGARILADDGRRYDGDPYLTVAAYNAGPGAAARWLEQLDGIADRDIYLAWIGYPETRRYVEKVLMDREIYDWIIASDAAARATEEITPNR